MILREEFKNEELRIREKNNFNKNFIKSSVIDLTIFFQDPILYLSRKKKPNKHMKVSHGIFLRGKNLKIDYINDQYRQGAQQHHHQQHTLRLN